MSDKTPHDPLATEALSVNATTGAPQTKFVQTEQQVGPYHLLKALGEGGMGTVWLAEQLEPVRRQVALKVIKASVGSIELLARFDAERQALAMMNHPNIAKILDAGTTAIGQPYFAMELVQGKTLIQYCDQNRLSINDRLTLFIDVCSGVQHAHQKGIIHRDLKPSNIMVAEIDGKAVPKVIDFGLAKAIDNAQRLTDEGMLTEIGQVLGTLKYMSPEQAGLDAIDIDTRTDVYALGVILYELLAGSTPLDDATIKGKAVLRILELIRSTDPVKPSSRLSGNSSTDTSITDARQTDNSQLTRILEGDLDWVVMKALDKDRNRRYETVSSFSADLIRYLNCEPVTARPPSLSYRIRKFTRKNRGYVAAASALSASLLLGFLGTAISLRQAILLADSERQAREQSELRLLQVEKGNQILGDLFSDLDIRQIRSEPEPLERVLADRIVKTGSLLETELIGSPISVARMQNQLGESLMSLGFPADAVAMFKQSQSIRAKELGEEHPDTLVSMKNLAMATAESSTSTEVIPLLEKTLSLQKKTLGIAHKDTLVSMGDLGLLYGMSGDLEKAVPLLEQTHQLMSATLGANDHNTIVSKSNLAKAYLYSGRAEEALKLMTSAEAECIKELGPIHPDTLLVMSNLAELLLAVGDYESSLPKYEKVYELRKSTLGPDHRDTLISLNSIARVYEANGELASALPLLEEAYTLTKKKLGIAHQVTLSSMLSLAMGFDAAGDSSKAIPLYEQCLELLTQTLGKSHSDTLNCMNSLAVGYDKAGNLDKAIPLYEMTLEEMKAIRGAEHPDTLNCMMNLAGGYWAANRVEESIKIYRDTIEKQTSTIGRDHPDTLFTLMSLGSQFLRAQRFDEAIPMLEEVVPACSKYPKLSVARDMLRNAYGKTKQREKLLERVDQDLTSVREIHPSQSLELAGALASISNDLLQFDETEKAEVYLRECLAIREKLNPEHWTTFNTKVLLGKSLLKQGKHADSEPLLLAGFEGLERLKDSIPPSAQNRLTEAIQSLIEFYKETNNNEKMEAWSKRLNEFQPR